MITYKQIKAARCLLDWRQVDLAEKAGLAVPTINVIERNIGSPRQSTLEMIKVCFEREGVVFRGKSGVELIERRFDIMQYEGKDFIEKQNDDLFSCMQSAEDEVYMCGLNEAQFEKYAPDQILRYEAHHKATQFKEKILVREGDTYLLANPNVYRWISKELIGKVPHILYKDRFVMIDWEAQRTVIIQNQAIAESFKKQFLYLWKLAKPIPKDITRKLDNADFVRSLREE